MVSDKIGNTVSIKHSSTIRDKRVKIVIKTMNEEKINERALLLIRFYWINEIYNLGKELHLPYFDQFENYWDMDYHQGALEISKEITDAHLLRLTKERPPKYELNLGGFQGNYYTATEKGEVELASSWGNVRENVRTSFDKWGEKSYGVLQTIINKGGRAAYFDIIDETEKVLGYEYVPSYLLPRLGPLKLLFKTGSNKYPDWTMPPEIIQVVQEELTAYRESVEKTEKVFIKEEISLKDEISAQILRSDRAISYVADKIVQRRREINLIFSSKFKTKLFKENETTILDIRKLCGNEENFNNRIQTLTTLIDGIETAELKKYINKETSGSINILEAFLKRYISNYNKKIIANLRNIVTLRSKKYPIHRDDPKFIEALKYFSFKSFPSDWGELWEVILRKYLESIEELKKCLNTL